MAKEKNGSQKADTKYGQLISEVFSAKFRPGMQSVEFTREEIITAAQKLDIGLPKNVGDVVYSFRYRKEMPEIVKESTPEGQDWIIVGKGNGQYSFVLSETPFVMPNPALEVIKIPDNTPEIIERYRLSDEQGLLSKVRYNRLIDTFLGITAYSLQNHLRTNVQGIGQIEIDEVYVGVNKRGQHFIVPVQAKGGDDKIGVVQLSQDMNYCATKFPTLICLPVAVQFMSNDVIAMFHMTCEGVNARIKDERHYKLVQSSEIQDEYLAQLNVP